MPGTMTLLVSSPRRRPTGSALQAAVLGAIDAVAPDLAQRLHDGGSPPHYHLALLPAESREQRLLHIGLVDDADFYGLLSSWMRHPPAALDLDGERVTLASLDARGGAVPWDALASRSPARVRLHFRSPTLFRAPSLGPDGPRPVRVFPSPERTLDALVRRWNAFSPLPIEPSGLAEWVNETDMCGEVVDWGGAHPIRGFIGSIVWTVTGRHREIGALLGLGEHLGVGSRTSQGCGHLDAEMQ